MFRASISIFLSLIFLLSVSFAQIKTKGTIGRERAAVKKGEQAEPEIPLEELKIGEDVLERAIDPNQYIVGPGDVIEVKVWGGMEQIFLLKVSPEGYLSIPTVGDIMVGDSLLSSVKIQVKQAAEKVYKTGEVSVNLNKLRRFRVPVTGILEYPGVYEVSGVDRVSLVIRKARSIEGASSQRNIQLVHQNGDSERVDLLMFFRTSDLSFNPYLRQGDAVHVPPLTAEIGILSIFGAVKLPGDYEYAPGDKIKDVISLSGGFADNAKNDDITLARSLGNSAVYESFKFDLVSDDQSWEFPLKADDRIYINSQPDYHLRHNVTIMGEVVFPGVYSIVEVVTRLSDVIERAGGLTDKANLRDAEIIRKADEEILDPEFERLKLIPVADMNNMEYEYFKTKSREKSFVVVDFEALLLEDDTTQNVPLRDMDVIIVPVKAYTVKVTGQVVNPGLLKWEKGKDYLYYLDKAGGLSFNARTSKIRVIKASTGKWVKPDKDTLINVGDTIFVPEKPERDYWALYKDLMLIVTQMATLVIMVRSLSG